MLDYARNRIYCGTDQPSAGQSSLWAIDTNTGALVWQRAAGSLHNRPQLGFSPLDHLYTADMAGNLVAVNPNTGALAWTTSVAAGSYVARNLWAEFRAPFTDYLFVTDGNSALHVLQDTGAAAQPKWTLNAGGGISSMAVVFPSAGKCYVGTQNGSVHQVDIPTGVDEASRRISQAAGGTPNFVGDPTLDVQNGAADINKVLATGTAKGGTTTKQFCVPFAVGSTGS
jgi:outer membrane protein assembly factor BamB